MMNKEQKFRHRMPTVREVAHHLYEREVKRIAQRIEPLNANPSHSGEELNLLPLQTPVRAMKDAALLADYATEQHWSAFDTVAVLHVAGQCHYWLKDIDVDEDCALTYGEARKLTNEMQICMVYLHRINYVLHSLMLRVSDIIDSRGRLRFHVKKAWKRCEDVWQEYSSSSFRRMDKAAWYAYVDHLGIYADAVMPTAEQVYAALRDRMIALGWKDVEPKARIELALRMGRVCAISFRQFFDEVHKAHGISLHRLLRINDLTPMTNCFAEFSAAIGIPTVRDEQGILHVRGFEKDNSPRVGWAWKRFINDLRDLDKQDSAALKAISLSPERLQTYRQEMEAAEQSARLEQEKQKQREMEHGFKELEEKFKVTKL